MAGNKRLLLETLIELGSTRTIPSALPLGGEDVSVDDYIRACMVTLTSHTVDSMTLLERLSYGEWQVDESGVTVNRHGICVGGEAHSLEEVLEALQRLERVPDVVVDECGLDDLNDLRAALLAVRCILWSLQWSDTDIHFPNRYTHEEKDKVLRASLKGLRNFRRYGEP